MADELLWAYCVLRAGDPAPAGVPAVEPAAAVEAVEAEGLVALVSRVPDAQFSAEPLRENLNDLRWLERVARAHEAVLDQALAEASIVPLRLCTLYESPERVREMLRSERDTLMDALDFLAGRQEWGVKVLIDRERLEEAVRGEDFAPAEPGSTSAGAAYLLRRRMEREERESARALAAALAEDVDSSMRSIALAAVTRPAQNRELSGYEGEMLLNAAYLVEAQRVADLRERAAELAERHAAVGARIELTGPWPPYNFVPDGEPGVAA